MGSQGALPDAPRARSLGALALLVVLVTPGVIVWLWSRPMPATPRDMPPLALSPDAIEAQLARDAALAARAPEGEQADARLAAYRACNAADLDAQDRPERSRARLARLEAALARLVEAHGEEARDATRARDLEAGMRALGGEGSEAERAGAIGAFADALAQYGMVEGRRRIAPRFVIRTTFKARWNALHGRPLTEGFGDAEREAYWGWLALHADGAASTLRLEGLERYQEVGGERAAEARAFLLLAGDRRDDARAAFEEAYEERPTFRLRNHALAVGTD